VSGSESVDNARFISQDEAWLAGREPMIALEINGDARAYPLQILTAGPSSPIWRANN
jgi:hypothetical protein